MIYREARKPAKLSILRRGKIPFAFFASSRFKESSVNK
jgi:hypothetical protein